jgi:hypothetical protein
MIIVRKMAALALVFSSVAAADPYGTELFRPPTGNDFRLKVLFKLDVDYQLDDASLSGAAPLALRRPELQSGDAQAAALAARADYLSSEHVLGTEGLGWSHLRLYYNGYLLQRFQDVGSSVFPTAYLLPGQKTEYDVRSGYAEINGFRDQGFWSHAFLRAGRQFRYGAGVATFDGLTLGWAGRWIEATAWGGRRSPRFLDDTDPGFVAGADLVAHLDPKAALDLAVDYLMYAARPTASGDFGVRHLLAASARWRARSGGRLLVSLSSFDFAGLRGHAAFTQPLGRPAALKLYADVKLGRDMVYDFVAGFGLAPSRFFTLPDIEPRLRLGARVDHTIGRRFEYALYLTANVVLDGGNLQDAGGWTGATAFDAHWEELGAIARVTAAFGITPEVEYRIRFVERQAEGGLFSDTSQAGEHRFQEVRADVRARPWPGLTLSLGAIYRVYDYVTRYVLPGRETTVENDLTIAGSASAELTLLRLVLLRARYEVGHDSTAFAPELDIVHRLVATVGGRF